MNNSSIRKRLLTEKDLTLGNATSIALSLDISSQENKLIHIKREPDAIQNILNGRRRCFRCDGEYHLANTCRYKNAICHKCKKTGHLAKVCKNTSANPLQSGKTYMIAENNPEIQVKHGGGCHKDTNVITAEDEIALIYTRGEPYKIPLKINDRFIEFEIDTGAGRTIISENIYRDNLKHIPLVRTTITLKTYSGENLKVIGKILVTLRHEETVIEEYIYIVGGNGPTLLGWDILSKIKLDWSTVYRVKYISGRLDELKGRYNGLFSEKIGMLTGFKAKIHVQPDAAPKFRKPCKVAFALHEAVRIELKQLEDDGILTSVPNSDWASPIVVVPKADGQIRICGNFKATINPYINTEQYPLPWADELFQKMQGGMRFSKLDLKTAYLQMELDDESKKYLNINTEDGLKQFNRMPYSITSGPAIFLRKLAHELMHIEMTVVNIDDILISSKNDDEHERNLELVFEKLTDLGLTLNVKKCKFFQKYVEYVGFILSEHGIQTNPEKVDAVIAAPEPTNVTELQSFLGAVNYYGKFINGLSTMASCTVEMGKTRG